MSARELTTDALLAALDGGGLTVVDALPPAPFAVRHLPGALNVTAEDDDATVAEALPDRGAAIVTYSTDGACTRGPELAARLVALGYTDVSVYVDGIAGWVAAGHEVETG